MATDFSLRSEAAHPARAHVGSLDTLQRDMLDALHHDQTKQQVNDAKLRAVAQLRVVHLLLCLLYTSPSPRDS